MKRKKVNHSIFFIIIPLCALFISFVFDFAIIIIENNRLEYVTKDIIEESLTYTVNDYYLKVKESYEKQKITTDSLEVEYLDGKLTIYNSHTYTSFFGKVIGIKNYRSEIYLTGYKNGDNTTFEEVQDE